MTDDSAKQTRDAKLAAACAKAPNAASPTPNSSSICATPPCPSARSRTTPNDPVHLPYLHTAPPLHRVMLRRRRGLPGILVLIYWQGSRWPGQLAPPSPPPTRLKPCSGCGATYALPDGSVLVTAVLLARRCRRHAGGYYHRHHLRGAARQTLYGGLGKTRLIWRWSALLLISLPAQ